MVLKKQRQQPVNMGSNSESESTQLFGDLPIPNL